jgi:isoamylase
MRSDWGLYEFFQRAARLRAEHPVFRRRRFFHGSPVAGSASTLPDIRWLTPAAEEMTERDWNAGHARAVTVFLNGDAIAEPDGRGEPVRDSSFLLLFNAHHEKLQFTVPAAAYGEIWESELDTAMPLYSDRPRLKAGAVTTLESRSLLVVRRIVP